MRLVVQRVKKAEVKNAGKIGKGLFVLVGIGKNDTKEKAITLAARLSKLRIMADVSDKMNLSIKETTKELLVVSQFTLHGNVDGGNRPSFINAMNGVEAKGIYETFVQELKNLGLKVEIGTFGQYMDIDVSLDGPVTIVYSD